MRRRDELEAMLPWHTDGSWKSGLIDLPRITDPRGNLSVVENGKEIPFDIKRVYWIYDVPEETGRGEHAHLRLWQLIVAVSGSFTVEIDDGFRRERFFLNHPYKGLLVSPGVWRVLEDFSNGAVCMTLASTPYEEGDYIRDHNNYTEYIRGLRQEARAAGINVPDPK